MGRAILRTRTEKRGRAGEMVVQKGVLESPFSSLPPKGLLFEQLIETIVLSIFVFWRTISLHHAFSAPLAHPHIHRHFDVFVLNFLFCSRTSTYDPPKKHLIREAMRSYFWDTL